MASVGKLSMKKLSDPTRRSVMHIMSASITPHHHLPNRASPNRHREGGVDTVLRVIPTSQLRHPIRHPSLRCTTILGLRRLTCPIGARIVVCTRTRKRILVLRSRIPRTYGHTHTSLPRESLLAMKSITIRHHRASNTRNVATSTQPRPGLRMIQM